MQDGFANTTLASRLLAALAVAYGVLFLGALFEQAPILLVQYIRFGLDFEDFLRAARDFLAGLDPYARARFVTPPLSALIGVPLAGLDDATAARVFFAVNVAAVVAAVGLLARVGIYGRGERRALALLPLLAAPSLMLIERGNIDGLVALLIAVALARPAWGVVTGFALALAASIKIYPAILYLPLLLSRRYRAVAAGLAVAVLSVALFPELFLAFVHNQGNRAGWVRIDENLSIYAYLIPLYANFPPAEWPVKALYALIVGGVAVYGLLADRTRLAGGALTPETRALLASWLVFTVTVPTLVYLYTGVTILLMVAVLSDARIRLAPDVGRILFVGCFLVLMPAKSIELTLLGDERLRTLAVVVDLLPPLGSAFLLTFFVRLRRDPNGLAAAAPA